MPKSQLPGLMMATFLVQTLTAPALSKYAKGSLRRRNQMLLFGVVPLVAANAAFALVPTSSGEESRLLHVKGRCHQIMA